MGDEPIKQQVFFLEVPFLWNVFLRVLFHFLVLWRRILKEIDSPFITKKITLSFNRSTWAFHRWSTPHTSCYWSHTQARTFCCSQHTPKCESYARLSSKFMPDGSSCSKVGDQATGHHEGTIALRWFWTEAICLPMSRSWALSFRSYAYRSLMGVGARLTLPWLVSLWARFSRLSWMRESQLNYIFNTKYAYALRVLGMSSFIINGWQSISFVVILDFGSKTKIFFMKSLASSGTLVFFSLDKKLLESCTNSS